MRATSSESALRLSITDRCNLRCRYCMPANGVPVRRHGEILHLEELADLVRWLAPHVGLKKIKLTGGEPLVRKNAETLVKELVMIPGVAEVSATTNGTLLPAMAVRLAEAGLARVNVSLDTLDPARFAVLTRGGRLADALAGLDAALAAGLVPVKLNSVLLGESWRVDVSALLDLAASRDLGVRFIELMRAGTEAQWAASQLVEVATVRRWLGVSAPIGPARRPGGPARIEKLPWRGGTVEVGWITPQSHPFCSTCSRLRIDPLGQLRRCLMDPETLPLADLRRRRGDELARCRLASYLDAKRPPASMASDQPMVAVGG